MIAIALVFIIALILDFAVIDKLLQYEYEEHRSQWIDDGRPRGFLWNPEERSTFVSGFGFPRNALMGSWFYSTPDWIKKGKQSIFLVWLHRFLYGILILVIIYLVVITLITGKAYYPF